MNCAVRAHSWENTPSIGCSPYCGGGGICFRSRIIAENMSSIGCGWPSLETTGDSRLLITLKALATASPRWLCNLGESPHTVGRTQLCRSCVRPRKLRTLVATLSELRLNKNGSFNPGLPKPNPGLALANAFSVIKTLEPPLVSWELPPLQPIDDVFPDYAPVLRSHC